MTTIDLAVWRNNLPAEVNDDKADVNAKKGKNDVERARQERCINCGANIVIENVLPFLKLP